MIFYDALSLAYWLMRAVQMKDGQRLFGESLGECLMTDSEAAMVRFGKCPRCLNGFTTKVNADGMVFNHCRPCGGIWVDDRQEKKTP